jgi:phage/plasmid primase-like uncharacterized protein
MTALPRNERTPGGQEGYDAIAQFTEAIRDAGLQPPEAIVPDGELHRFASDDSRGDDPGWYVLHVDSLPAGAFGCWRTGVEQTWCATRERPLSRTEQVAHRENMDTIRRKRDADRERRQADAALAAGKIWDAAQRATDHPYLAGKGIKPHGVRQHHDGRLIVPVRIGQRLRSLQFIDRDGAKLFLKDGQVAGGYFSIGTTKDAKSLCIVEGFATGASVHEATDHPVAVAFNAGNLQSVTEVLHESYPDLQLIVCGDDDPGVAGNPGRSKATEAARSVGARLALPGSDCKRLEGVTDFNDLESRCGNDAVRASVDCALSTPTVQVSSDEWPALVSLDTANLPRLQSSWLPGWAGDYAEALAHSTETPPELTVALTLASCSVAAARRVHVCVGPGYHEPCNLWLVVALVPGNRKSSVQTSTAAPLLAWERDTATQMKPQVLQVTSERMTLEARAKELRSKSAKDNDRQRADENAKEAADIEASLPDVPRTLQLWTSDATPEKMGPLLADNDERMAWLSSEGGVFDMLRGRYSNGIPNLDLMLKAWSGDSERVDRGSRPPVYLRHPLLTVGLAPQPEVLRGLAANPGFRGRGLTGRFLYLIPPSPLGYRTLNTSPVPEALQTAYCEGVKAMLNWPSPAPDNDDAGLHLLELTPEAHSEWLAFARCMETAMRPGGDFENATDWAGKAPGAAVRLCGVLHGIKHAHGRPWEVPIEAETMASALEIMAVIARHSLAAFDLMGVDESISSARRVWQWIVGGRRANFTIRDAYQALKGTFPRVAALKSALGVLEERGYVVVEVSHKDGPGRPPSPMVTVRPDLAEEWR